MNKHEEIKKERREEIKTKGNQSENQTAYVTLITTTAY
jgi:hypothetical protein